MKAVKLVLTAILAVVVLIVAAVLALPLWIGLVVPPVSQSVVPTVTGTPFAMGSFALNPYSGRLELTDVKLDNPQGFQPLTAFSVGRVYVDVSTPSLATDTIVIEDVQVKDLFLSYVSNAKNVNNFDVIVRHAKGDRAGASEPAKTAKPDVAKPSAEAKKTAAPKGEAKPGKKVIIDHIRIEGVRVQWGPLVLPIPAVEMSSIGRSTMGVDWAGAWDEIAQQFIGALGAAGANLQNLGAGLQALGVDANKQMKTATDAMQKLGVDANRQMKTATDAMQKLGVDSGKQVKKATDVLQKLGVDTGAATMDATKGVGSGAGAAVTSAGQMTSGTTKAVSDGATGATKAVGESASDAVKAVNESAEKAAGALKSLFGK